jgi:hypothetical protein
LPTRRAIFLILHALFFLLCAEPVRLGGWLGRKIKLELFFFETFYFLRAKPPSRKEFFLCTLPTAGSLHVYPLFLCVSAPLRAIFFDPSYAIFFLCAPKNSLKGYLQSELFRS